MFQNVFIIRDNEYFAKFMKIHWTISVYKVFEWMPLSEMVWTKKIAILTE